MQHTVSALRIDRSRSGEAVALPGGSSNRSGAAPRGAERPETVVVEDVDVDGAAAIIGPWRALAARSRDANAYFEPDFALAAAVGAGKRLRFLLAWEGGRDRLVGVCPIVLPRLPLPFGTAHLWSHKNATCAMPLLDPSAADRAWAEILNHGRRTWPWVAAVAVAGARVGQTIGHGSDYAAYAAFERAMLDCSAAASSLRPSGARTLRKCRRRLERLGRVDFRLCRAPAEVALALESFLELEAKGWKRGRGALASHPDLATFARAAVNGLAAHERCRIAALDLDGTPVAMGVVLISARRAFFWKIAYDEDYAACSPGALLGWEMTHALRADADIDIADSCADAGHPMIEKLWPGRERVATVFAAIRPGPAFRVAVAAEILRLEARRRLKDILYRIRRVRRELR